VATSSSASMLATMQRLEQLPFGKAALNFGIRWAVPYAATLRPEIELVAPGHARVRMRDRRAVRNHLASVHAAALFNLAEMAANLALMSRTPEHGRWIITGMDIEYRHKARGGLVAEAQLPEFDWSHPHDVQGEATILDAKGAVVAVARPRWRIGPHGK
jgi:acyl-coenzyme A thioesterase PaaI-like protein